MAASAREDTQSQEVQHLKIKVTFPGTAHCCFLISACHVMQELLNVFLVLFMMQLLAQSPGALETPAMLLTLPPDCAPPASMPPSFAAPGLTLHSTHAWAHHQLRQPTTDKRTSERLSSAVKQKPMGGAHVLSRPLFVLAPVVVLSCPRLPADDQPHFSSRAPWACSARPSTRIIMQARMTAVGNKLRYLLQPC